MSCKYCELCGCVTRDGSGVVLAPALPGLIIDGKKVSLTNKEFTLVRQLFQALPSPVLDRSCIDALYEWHDLDFATGLLKHYVHRINRKLVKHDVHIHRVKRIGYQLVGTGKE